MLLLRNFQRQFFYLRWKKRFESRLCQGCNQQFFRAGEVSWNKGISTTGLYTNTWKKGLAGKHFRYFFSKTLLKQHFKWDIKSIYEHNQDTFLNILKKGRRNSTPSYLVPPLYVLRYLHNKITMPTFYDFSLLQFYS